MGTIKDRNGMDLTEAEEVARIHRIAIQNSKRLCCENTALNMPTNLENSEVATGLEKVSFHSNPKEG